MSDQYIITIHRADESDKVSTQRIADTLAADLIEDWDLAVNAVEAEEKTDEQCPRCGGKMAGDECSEPGCDYPDPQLTPEQEAERRADW